MPSVHAADALIIGVALAATVRRRWLTGLCLLWPLWVSFSVLATANHYWLDVVAGAALAGPGAIVAARLPSRPKVAEAVAPTISRRDTRTQAVIGCPVART